jgi:hypothetical protein
MDVAVLQTDVHFFDMRAERSVPSVEEKRAD